MSSAPSPTMLRNLLRYEPDTGKLFWRERTPVMFSGGGNGREANCATWNNMWADKEAFTATNACGYYTGAIFNKGYLAHRVIWAMAYGSWPDKIDHGDHDGANNRMENISDTTQLGNTRNQTISKRNKSGATGVTWCKDRSVWSAQIQVFRKKIFLGYFAKKTHAIAARKDANVEYGFHKNHGSAVIKAGQS